MKKVYLSPVNDISKKLSFREDFKKDYELLGFIDKDKHGKDIYSHSNKFDDFDYILICSPKYYDEIYIKFIGMGIDKKKILFYKVNENQILSRNKYINFLNHERIKDYKNIIKLKHKHKDKRIFLIGNGPSLKNEDLNLLKDEITFAANKIYLAFKNTTWRPTYYLVEDDLVYKQNYNAIKNLKDTMKLFPNYAREWAGLIEDGAYFNLKYFPTSDDFPQFNPDPINGMFWGSTVVFTMIQWAIYLGSKEIYLLGVDFSFDVPKKQIVNEYNRIDLICEGEINHFHKDYRKIGEKWNLPKLEIQVKSFTKAKEYAEEHVIKIYNASRETKLDVFERINFDKLF
jgi:hypothetical protein